MTIGIICAMPEEVASFLPQSSKAAGEAPEFLATKIGGLDVVVASSGLGKVRAAVAASILVERWGCRALISAGTAGGLSGTAPMQVVVACELIQHDYGRSRGLGELDLYRPGIPPLPEYSDIDHTLRLPAERTAKYEEITQGLDFVTYGKYASGDTFVNDRVTRTRLESFGAIAVDMECGAVAQVAEHLGVPWLVAKGISDDASTTSHEDFLAGIEEASRRSGRVVEALLPVLLET
jgi:adenosylhomocysteine nucleosidase